MTIEPEEDRLAEARDATNLASLSDTATGWYDTWYFALRLDEEIARADRTKKPLCLIRFQIKPPKRANTPDDSELLALLEDVTRSDLRSYDLPAKLGRYSYAVLLPDTVELDAIGVAHRLAEKLDAFELQTKLLVFPRDADSAVDLLSDATFEEIWELKALPDSNQPTSIGDFRNRKYGIQE